MSRDVESVFPLAISVQQLERQPVDDLREAERGVVFIAASPPPRVGTRVQVDITTPSDTTPLRVVATVVWSRPGRAGVVAGFRGQLIGPPPDLLVHIKDLAEAARARIEHREAELKRATLDVPITERVRMREITAPMRTDSRSTPPSSRPVPQVPPSTPSFGSRAVSSSEAVPSFENTSRQRTSPTIRVGFSSSRNYLLHYEQFLSRGTVYVSSLPAPAIGTLIVVTLEIPDGDTPLVVSATVERTVAPPEVPQTGWVAKIVDLDGSIGERLTTATFMVSTSTAPPKPRP